jgi:hypothetical protein
VKENGWSASRVWRYPFDPILCARPSWLQLSAEFSNVTTPISYPNNLSRRFAVIIYIDPEISRIGLAISPPSVASTRDVGPFDTWHSLGNPTGGSASKSHGSELSSHYLRLATVDDNLPQNRGELQKANNDEQPVSQLHLRLVALGGTVLGYWISFWGILDRWRSRLTRVNIIGAGIFCFISSMGLMVMTALYPLVMVIKPQGTSDRYEGNNAG